MDDSNRQDKSPSVQVALRPGGLPVILVVTGGVLFMALPFVPAGFIPLLPVIPAVAWRLFERRAWRSELRRMMSPVLEQSSSS
jgi:hypothetical protein